VAGYLNSKAQATLLPRMESCARDEQYCVEKKKKKKKE
jgi:hypothetical protein